MESVILSSWDHIMGPQIQKLWVVNDCTNNGISEVSSNSLRDFNISKHNKDVLNSETRYLPDMEIYSIMCGQLLLSEVDACKPNEEWASRLYMSESKIMVAVVFHISSWTNCTNAAKDMKDACLCFGTIFKCKDLNFVLSKHAFIDQHLRRIVGVLQNSMMPFDSTMKKIDENVRHIIFELNSLIEQRLGALQMLNYSSFQSFINSDIVLKALASHLQTSGCTAVIGSSEFSVSQVMQALSMFSCQKESYCSPPVLHVPSKSYVKGIFIQGSNKNASKECEFLLERAFQESLSLTVVDIDSDKVWQTIAIQDSNNIIRNSPYLVNASGLLITQFLNDLAFIQENKGNCGLFIENFNIFIFSKAVSLIKTIESFRQNKGILVENEIMTMFGIQDLADLQIFLGCAEKLKPGFRTTYVSSL